MSNRIQIDYINDILMSINDIENFIKNYSYEDFLKDRKTQLAVIRALEVIGEAVKKIDIKLKEKFSDVPWKEIAGMRDKLIHEYFGIDLKIVWTTCENDIAEIRNIILIIKDFVEKTI